MSGQSGTGETVIQRATEQFEDSPPKITLLGRGLYIFFGDGGNVTAIVDDGSTLLIDSGMASRSSELKDTVFKATMRPVTRLINTYCHFDHTGGNVLRLWRCKHHRAAERKKTALVGAGRSLHWYARWPLSGAGTPNKTVTYSSTMALRQGSQRLTLANYGAARTDGDTITYIAPANVVVVGDIFSNAFYPIIDLTSGGSIDGMILSVDRPGPNRRADKGRPGHGPEATRADLQAYRDMLAQIRQRIQKLIAAGKTMDEVVAAAPTKDFDAKWGSG